MVQQWDYMTLGYGSGDSTEDIEDDLKSWGGRGWELVGVVQTLTSPLEADSMMFASGLTLFMKRPL